MTIDDFMKYLPTLLTVLGALGLWKIAAALGSRAWASVKAKAKKSPAKWDDAIVEAIDPQVRAVLDLVERGDFAAAQSKVNAIKAAAKRK